MQGVFIYWDNSNIHHEAQRLAEQNEQSPSARHLVRIHFDNLMRLAHADRSVVRALAAGSVPPEMSHLWNRMEMSGVQTRLYAHGSSGPGKQDVPDYWLRLGMLEDAIDHSTDPGTAVMLTGDGAGYLEGSGLYSTLERLHNKGWRVEILSWKDSCNQRMRQWAEQHGCFVALDDFYDSITFREPSRPGHELALSRDSVPLDLSTRPMA